MNILVLTHRPIFPPVNGYSRLICDTYSELANIDKNIHIDIATIIARSNHSDLNLINLNVRNFIIKEPKDVFYKLLPSRLLLRMFRERCLSIHLNNLVKTYRSSSVISVLKSMIKLGYVNEPDIIISETIYPVTVAEELSRIYDIPILLRTHNIEVNYICSLSGIFRGISYKKILNIESNAVRISNKVITISYYDKLVMKYIYDLDPIYIPPIIKIRHDYDKKILNKLGLRPFRYVLFPASDHKPNREFLKYVIKIGHEIKKYDMDLVISGSISKYAKKYTKQAKILGVLSYQALNTLMKFAYLIIAPHHGNGTPIKVIEAIHNGTPVLTTKNVLYSLRELKEIEYELIGSNIYDFPKLIRSLINGVILYDEIRNKVKKLSKILNSRKLAKRYLEEIYKVAHSSSSQ